MRVDCLPHLPGLMPSHPIVESSSRRQALDSFLRHVERRALRLAEFSSGGRDDAMDLVQEAMYGFVRRYSDRPQVEWSVLFWRVLNSRLTDHHRRARSRWSGMAWFANRDAEDGPEDPIARVPDLQEPGPMMRLADAEALQALEAALRSLPLRQRQAFLLRVWEGLSVIQTAAVMQLTEGSVKTHLYRALQQLRTRLGVHHEP